MEYVKINDTTFGAVEVVDGLNYVSDKHTLDELDQDLVELQRNLSIIQSNLEDYQAKIAAKQAQIDSGVSVGCKRQSELDNSGEAS